MGLLIFAWIFRNIWLKMGVFFWGGQNGGRDGAMLIPNELVLTFWGFYACANFGENRSRNATVRVLADGHTHIDYTQTQIGFIICPMLYAIAMGQIIIWNVRTAYKYSFRCLAY